MTKTAKTFSTNILLLLLIIISLYTFNQYQNNTNIYIIQKIIFFIILGCSLLLIYINDKNRVQDKNFKMTWVIFELLGVLGTIYSLIVLSLIFIFRNGIGF